MTTEESHIAQSLPEEVATELSHIAQPGPEEMTTEGVI